MISPPKSFLRALSNGFTLLEVLVVIAVLGLLVSLLLPVLHKARVEGWKAVSLANVHSIAQAGAAYQNEQKGYLPIVSPGDLGVGGLNSGAAVFCTWTGWGKDCSAKWASVRDGWQDIPAAARPLNPYLSSDRIPDIRLGAEVNDRGKWQMPGCKDPSDKIGHQWDWNSPLRSSFTPRALENFDGTSCYEDVGSSYLFQSKWFFQTLNSGPTGLEPAVAWARALRSGVNRFRLADTFQPSRMIWMNDEYCDITINRQDDTARVVNGYGDTNKSVVGFMDGHAKYLHVIPGGESSTLAYTRPDLVPAFNNSNYTVVFPYGPR